jgi:PAS domain S-box-containing protein
MSDQGVNPTQIPQVLIVDDTPANLKLLAEILTAQGYRVRPATNGRLALRSVAAEEPDLVLLDVRMPDMDGYEVCRRLKSNEQSRGIPVIFISALDDVADKVKGFKAGGVDYIAKPFESTEVLARVKTHLALRHLQKQLELQNSRLQQEIAVRAQTEEELRKHKTHLEELVDERTAEIRKINEDLRREIIERKQAEEAFKILIHSAPIGIFVIGDGKFELANPGFQKTTGYNEPELVGKDHLFAVASEFKANIREKASRVLDGQTLSPYEYRIVDKEGATKWIMERATCVPYRGKKVILGCCMDITARKRAEETLKASRARFRELNREVDPQ